MFSRDNAQQPSVVDDLNQGQAVGGLFADCRKCALKAVQQEDMKVVMDLHLLPLLQRTVLKRGPAIGLTQGGEHTVDARILFSTREHPFQLVGQLNVAAGRGDPSIVVR